MDRFPEKNITNSLDGYVDISFVFFVCHAYKYHRTFKKQTPPSETFSPLLLLQCFQMSF